MQKAQLVEIGMKMKMTYKLESIIKKISSPVVLVIDGEERYSFANGKDACTQEYDKYLLISDIRSDGSTVYITLVENERINDTNWCGEEQVSFF